MSVVLVTHDVEEAVALADRVVILTDGEIRHSPSIIRDRPRNRVSEEFFHVLASVRGILLGEK